jgi:hypothetical protein
LSFKQKAVYSFVIVCWGIAMIGSSFLVAMLVAFAWGMLVALYDLSRALGTVLSVSAFGCTIAAWIICDHRSNFMQSTALRAVDRWCG